MTYLRRPSLPPGRLTVRELCERAHLSRATFFARYRHDPTWQERLDLRTTADGVLHVSDASVAALRVARLGERATGATRRAGNLRWRAQKHHPRDTGQAGAPAPPPPRGTPGARADTLV